uniref:Uncharacterized protein n=1 Tax=Candidatus Kentrum sp. MB TaxID=2138164 RepID=A0A450WZY1_9GAMM|nr:MAG: hypothetical protein BECKMB1821G_GA0114241_100270 [Candidatus Kentron sp. MB]VFK28897.1 MAG: hypothetical protein BECKMB1821I_GA0114274_100776 [Candidatus Kentron sp. MB]VFK74144.1 MAG: hypothetical protein BECKMB1821H_GA0114242_100175 [Candidatus Kentron sp. MB]
MVSIGIISAAVGGRGSWRVRRHPTAWAGDGVAVGLEGEFSVAAERALSAPRPTGTDFYRNGDLIRLRDGSCRHDIPQRIGVAGQILVGFGFGGADQEGVAEFRIFGAKVISPQDVFVL